MATLARELGSYKPQRGRPREFRTIVADQGYVVVDETREALLHISTAVEIDRHCDLHTGELHAMLHRLSAAVQQRDGATTAAIAQAMLSSIHEIIELDALEEGQWRQEAPDHVGEARAAGREIITMLDRPEPAAILALEA